jgi:serine/threonine-protein kinase
MFINETIQIVQPIKAGGTSNLYLGVDMAFGNAVVIKELKPGFFKSEFVRDKFLEEANRYLYLSHPNIVKLKDFIDKGDSQYLVMEYIEGNDLSDYVSKISGPLPLYNIALLMNEVLGALNYVHKKELVHLDIKPSNIMLTNDDRVKLIDFGIAHDKTVGNIKNIMGSPSYMSPEQLKEGAIIDHRSDIYSLGITIYELLTGKLPFAYCSTKEELFEAIRTKPIPKVKPLFHVDEVYELEINKIIQKATFKDPESRYQSCEELQMDLLKFL